MVSGWREQWLAAAAGIVADAALGEPALTPHPVAAFGRLMQGAERRWYGDGRGAGVRYTAVGVGVGVAAGALVPTLAATYLAVAGCSLAEAGRAVAAALAADDLDQARSLLPVLVGRDPAGLDAKEVARAVVESVAENTVDAVVAPAVWAAAAGGAGALGYRAINTLDAMVGHHSDRYERFGWASAKLDDAANWVPARLTVLLVAAVRPRRAAKVWSVVRRHAAGHPSPNSGVAEAAFAAALGLRLGGRNRYGDRVELRPYLGDGRPAEAQDIELAVRLSGHVGAALAVGLAVPALWPVRR